MKKIAIAIAMVFAGLGQAFAAADPVLFTESWAPANAKATQAEWATFGYVHDRWVMVSKMTEIAQKAATTRGHESAKLSQEQFAVAFQKQNGFNDMLIPVGEFAKLAQAKQIKLPEVATAPVAAAPAVATKVMAPVQPTDSGLKNSLAELKGEVEKLSKRGIDTSDLRAEMKDIAAAQVLASTKGKFVELAGKLTTLQTETNKRLSALEGQVGKLEIAQAATAKSVTNLETGLKTTNGNVATLTKLQLEDRTAIKNLETGLKSAGGTSPWTWVALLGSVIAIGFALLRKRVGMTEKDTVHLVQKAVADKTAAFNQGHLNLGGEVAKMQTSLAAVKEEVVAIRRDGGIQSVVFGTSFDKAVSALKAGAKCVVWEAEIVGYPETWSLVIHNVGEGMVSVEGVKELTDAISLQSLQVKIGRAGQPWKTLPHRFVGVKEEDLPGFQPAEVTDFAETQSELPAASADPLTALNEAIGNGLGQVRPGDDRVAKVEKPIPAFLLKTA